MEIDSVGATKLADIFAKAVLAPVDEWLATLSEARAVIVQLDQARVVYDHYTSKLVTLQDEKRKMHTKNKIPDKAFEERLVRNVEKTREGEAVYLEVRDRSVGQLLTCFEEAGRRLDAVLLRTMQYEKQVFEDGVRSLRAWEAPIADLIQLGKDRKSAAQAAGLDCLTRHIASARADRLSNTPINLEPSNVVRSGGGAIVEATSASTARRVAASEAVVPVPTAIPMARDQVASWSPARVPSASVASAPAFAAAAAGNPFGEKKASQQPAPAGNPFGEAMKGGAPSRAAAVPIAAAAVAVASGDWGTLGDNSWDAAPVRGGGSASAANAWAGDFGESGPAMGGPAAPTDPWAADIGAPAPKTTNSLPVKNAAAVPFDPFA